LASFARNSFYFRRFCAEFQNTSFCCIHGKCRSRNRALAGGHGRHPGIAAVFHCGNCRRHSPRY